VLVPLAVRPGNRGGTVHPLLRGLVRTARRTATAGTVEPASVVNRLAGLDEEASRRVLVDLVRSEVAAVLAHDSADGITVDREFREIGMDSLTAVDLRNRLAGATGVRMSATLVFDYPTPAALAEHLLARLGGGTRQVDPGPALIAEIDRLEAALDTASPDPGTRAGIAARLRSLTARWSAAEADTEGGGVLDQLSAASNDEIFDFIDNQLGRLNDR
jgi:acyl carrier protein